MAITQAIKARLRRSAFSNRARRPPLTPRTTPPARPKGTQAQITPRASQNNRILREIARYCKTGGCTRFSVIWGGGGASWGRAFKLVVDHSALRWLHTMRDTMEGGPASRLMRWILKLAEYRFHVEHKPGVLHKDADAISRLVTDRTGGTGTSPRMIRLRGNFPLRWGM